MFPLQADTTDTEYKQADGGTHQEVMDLLECPEVRQRAQSIASVITSTMEGRWARQYGIKLKSEQGLRFSFYCGLFVRAWRVKTEVPPMLVHFCRNLPHLGMLSSMAEVQEDSEFDCNGSICRPNYHHLHRTKHTVYGYGTSSNVSQLYLIAVYRQFGEWIELGFF